MVFLLSSLDVLGGFVDTTFGDKSDHGISGGLASTIVVTRAPVSLLGGDVLLDVGTVEEPVLTSDLGDLGWLLELKSPGLNDGKIGLEGLELSTGFDGFWENPDDIANVLNNMDGVEVLEVGKEGLGVVDNGGDVGHATFELNAMIVTGEAVDETSGEIGDSSDGREINAVVGRRRSHGSNCDGDEVSKIHTRLEAEVLIPVGLDGGNVRLDLAAVEEVIVGDGLGELLRFSEYLGPSLNFGDIITNVLAGVDGLREITNDSNSELGSPDGIFLISLLEVFDGHLSVVVDEVEVHCTVIAGCQGIEVVDSSHTVDEPTHEFDGRLTVEVCSNISHIIFTI